MEKWELARYLIDAKKSVDTILYLSQHGEKVSMIDIRGIVNETRRTFYVNACIVLDKSFPKKKKEICENATIQSVYYEDVYKRQMHDICGSEAAYLNNSIL